MIFAKRFYFRIKKNEFDANFVSVVWNRHKWQNQRNCFAQISMCVLSTIQKYHILSIRVELCKQVVIAYNTSKHDDCAFAKLTYQLHFNCIKKN